MCGIVGYLGQRDAWQTVLAGLQRLEYRGYDSAGITVLTSSGELSTHKSVGKVKELAALSPDQCPKGHLALGHTRWATHGKPAILNAHPHTDCLQQIAVVHNGIVENYLQLKQDLSSKGHVFVSETDSEVIPHLIEESLSTGSSFEEAFIDLTTTLKGSQAVVATIKSESENKLLALRLGNAGGIVIAHTPGEAFVSSDLPAVVPYAKQVSFLDDGEVAVLTQEDVKYIGTGKKIINKRTYPVSQSSGWVDKEGYKHFMLKEIMEQPRAVASALRERVNFDNGHVTLEQFPLSPGQIQDLQKVVLIGCGTSLYATMVGRYFIEDLAGLPAEVDTASEFRYRNSHINDKTLVISVGQSGETADTLAAMSSVMEKGGRLLTVCNVEGSQSSRMAESTLYTRSGLEIGVASTKTFVASLVVLCLIASHLGQARGHNGPTSTEETINGLAQLPHLLGQILTDQSPYERLARRLYKSEHFLYLGRGLTYPIALEGALKLKEISYIHAEGYPAGEMKHGPIALIDPTMPVVAITPRSSMYSKMANNIKEVKARDGIVIAVASEGDTEIASQVDEVLYIPECPEILTPFLTVVPLQLLAYHIAVRRGCDVDQPRNLAKSVTVE